MAGAAAGKGAVEVTSKPALIVMGFMGQSPFAGVAWQMLHYLEDTNTWPFDPEQDAVTARSLYTARYIARLMAWCGLEGKWSYRSPSDGGLHGLSPAALDRLLGRAEILLNVTGATVLRGEHMRVPARIYVESDPFLAQVEVRQGMRATEAFLDAHTHWFTFGENIGRPGCGIPACPRFDF